MGMAKMTKALRRGSLIGVVSLCLALAPRSVESATSLPVSAEVYEILRDAAHLRTVAKERFSPPPLDVVVPGSLLIRRPAQLNMSPDAPHSVAAPIHGAHFVTKLADGRERWDFDAPLTAEQTVTARRDLEASSPELEIEH